MQIVRETLEQSGESTGIRSDSMEFIDSGDDPKERESLTFGKVNDYKYLGATLSTKNYCSEEINVRLNEAEKIFDTLRKFLE